MQKILVLLGVLLLGCTKAQKTSDILPGSYDLERYQSLLLGKNVGITTNHSSLVGKRHLVDTLKKLNIKVAKVFTPEHGFTGTVSDGETVAYDSSLASYELISLYGKNKKPTDEQVVDLDIMVFDMQDVGTRFYTYISTMHYVMEACAENNVPIIILDRPNPNGSYVDGPLLDSAFHSFVGMHRIPIVHGMTIGELAQMINGEGWLEGGLKCELTVVPVQNWDHSVPYSLPVRPSPNLPDDLSISLYPSLCLFEGTIMSVGRGTDFAFQQIGHPDYPDTTFSFTPRSREGAKWPPLQDQKCYGKSWTGKQPEYAFSLAPLIDAYQRMDREDFFNDYFKTLAGTNQLQEQIEMGMTEEEIKDSWQSDLDAFKKMRSKYLLYP